MSADACFREYLCGTQSTDARIRGHAEACLHEFFNNDHAIPVLLSFASRADEAPPLRQLAILLLTQQEIVVLLIQLEHLVFLAQQFVRLPLAPANSAQSVLVLVFSRAICGLFLLL